MIIIYNAVTTQWYFVRRHLAMETTQTRL